MQTVDSVFYRRGKMALISGNRLVVAVASALCALAMSTGVANAAAPLIASQSVTAITSTNATLNADINPNGLLTKYKLQIDATGNFKFFQADSCPLHPPGIFCTHELVSGDPLPPGLVEPPESSLPAGTESQHVSVNLARIGATLQPGTTYHFRAIAANSNGFTYGSDQTFTTPAEGEPPAVTDDEPKPKPAGNPLGIVERAPESPQPWVDVNRPGGGKKVSRCRKGNAHRQTARKQRPRRSCAAVATARVSRR
jgi:hypothetical protein